MTALILDLETQFLADEVGGWANIAKMKLACAVTLDLHTGQFAHYREAEVQALLADLRAASTVIGYNLLRFDYEVLRPYAGAPLELPTVDLLADLYRALGFRLSLDSLALATLGRAKTADGTLAVRWFRAGEVQKVLDYCQEDVQLTRDLYIYGRQHKHVKYRDRAGRLKAVPVQW